MKIDVKLKIEMESSIHIRDNKIEEKRIIKD